jgi:hypothetical protein
VAAADAAEIASGVGKLIDEAPILRRMMGQRGGSGGFRTGWYTIVPRSRADEARKTTA